MTEESIQSERGIEKHVWIEDIKANDRIHGMYLARDKKVGYTKKGDPFLSITLSDRTGDLESRVWENALDFASQFKEGDILEVEGNATSYRNRVQITLSSLKISDGKWDPSIFLETTAGDTGEMIRALRAIIMEIKDPHLEKLCERFLSDHLFMDLFKKAPAAKNFHHNYLGGLLEHTLSVCRMALSVTAQYPQLEKDLLIAAAFLHDIGKIREFKYARCIDYTDEGRLLGHLVVGVAMLDEKLAGIKHFPGETALRLKHLILSHHGQYEFGSPKRPKFLEAFALHLIDDLDAKMNGLSRYMLKDIQEGPWTEFNRMFERYLLKDKIGEVDDASLSAPADDGQKVLFTSKP